MTYIIMIIYASDSCQIILLHMQHRLKINIFVSAYGRESAQRVSRN